MLRSQKNRAGQLKLGASVAVLITVLGTGVAFAQAEPGVETVTVTGFRESLEKALDMKRTALDSTDSIMAEDIAKFPDLNVSESLQRIPGVTLARDAGEGREISVRGLNATFTRVRINGMEALATTGSEDIGGGTNRGRSFDFNVFASELFSQLTVHKSASANVEEGSLGATVDLHTGHPFDHPGFVFTVSGQGGYNDLAKSFNPRGAMLVSDTLAGGRLGVLFSAAYQVQNTLENGTSSVRWQNDNTALSASRGAPLVGGCETNVPAATSQCSTGQRFKSVLVTSVLPNSLATQVVGTTEITGSVANGANYNASIKPNNYDIVNEAFHPRFPRYDNITNHEKRLGMTGSVQWQPDDATLFTLDALFADFAVQRQEYYLEAESFSNNNVTNQPAGLIAPILGVGSINVLNYDVNQTNDTLDYIQATNVGLRSEHRIDHLDTRFQQATLDGTHDFSEDFKVHTLLGWSESHHRNPLQTTLTLEYDCTAATATGGSTANCPGGQAGGAGTAAAPYSFDYRGNLQKLPSFSYGNVDVTSPNGWFLGQIREREAFVYNSYRTAAVDFSYSAFQWLKVEGGFDYKNYGYGALITARTNGSTASQDTIIPSAIESPAGGLGAYTQLVMMHGLKMGTTPTTWIVPDINKYATLGIFDQTMYPTVSSSGAPPCTTSPGCPAFLQGPGQFLGQNGNVHENDTAGWLQFDWDSLFYGVPFRGNVGARYVMTQQSSVGYSYNPSTKAIITSTASHSYHDFLPALNAVFEPADDFLIRINAAQVMARPDLGNLLPGGATATVTGSNFNVTENNPSLLPYRAKNVDMSFEWYYHKGAMLSVAFFYKHLDSLIQTLKQNIPFNTNTDGVPVALAVAACGGAYVAPPASGCNEAAIWTFSKPVNSKGAPLYGTEINWQQPFDFLPHPFDSFGFLGNVTFVQATQTYFNSDGSILAKTDLTGLSRISYNATLYYDDSVFQARVTGSFRSKYIPSGGVNPGNLTDYLINGSTFNLDGSASYKYDDNFTVTLDALNLTNQFSYQYADSVGQRTYFNHQTGREIFLGLRYNY